MAERKKPAGGKKPAAKKPAAKKPAARQPKAPKKQPVPKAPIDDLELDDDFLDDLDAEIDDVVSTPTEEHPAPTGATDEVAPDDRHDADEDEDYDEELDDEVADDLDEEEDYEDEDYDEEEDDEEEEEADRPTLVGARAGGPPPAEAVSGNGFGRPRRRFPLWARFVTATFLIVASVAAATAASLILYLSDIADALNDNVGELAGIDTQLEGVDGGAPQTILVIGSDRREGDGQGHGLSDTTLLLRIDPDRNAIALFSIPRDLTVEIPGYGTAKFNEAYSYGGAKLTLKTVKALTGVTVNHVVNVDFTGFAKAVSAIGCVYVDVDRRYYHSNEGLAVSAQYSEINVRPGYQRLCGLPALQYVRFRHTDNDIVRNARQQDFLREARARVPASDLLTQRHDLIGIFTDYTSSDISSAKSALEVMKLLIEARDEPVKEVHFPGTVGRDVTATPGQIEQAVSQFLGIEGTKGPRGQSATPLGGAPAPPAETPPPPKVSKSEQKAAGKTTAQKAPKPKKNSSSVAGLEGGNYGKKLAYRVQRRNRKMPIYYPTTVIAGSEYAQKPRAYTLADHDLAPDERFAYKFVLKTPEGEYYGLQGLRWKDAPILDEPHETKEIGDRTYNLYYDNDRLRMVSWETDDGVYWIQNTLLQSLSADQMLAIARGAKVLEPTA